MKRQRIVEEKPCPGKVRKAQYDTSYPDSLLALYL
jgi:hypothetical protein